MSIIKKISYQVNTPKFVVYKRPGGYQAWKDKKPPKRASWLPIMGCLFIFLCMCTASFSLMGGVYVYGQGRLSALTQVAATVKITEIVESTEEIEVTEEIVLVEETEELEATFTPTMIPVSPTATIPIETLSIPSTISPTAGLSTPTFVPLDAIADATTDIPTAIPTRIPTQPPQVIYVQQTAIPQRVEVVVTRVIVQQQPTKKPDIIIVTATPTETATSTATETPTATPTETEITP